VDDQETLFFKTWYLEYYLIGFGPLPLHKSLGFCYFSLAWYYGEIGLFDQSLGKPRKEQLAQGKEVLNIARVFFSNQ